MPLFRRPLLFDGNIETTLDDFLPVGRTTACSSGVPIRVIAYVDSLTVKGSIVPGSYGNTVQATYRGVSGANAYQKRQYAPFGGQFPSREFPGSAFTDWTPAGTRADTPAQHSARFQADGLQIDKTFDPAGKGWTFMLLGLGQYYYDGVAGINQIGSSWFPYILTPSVSWAAWQNYSMYLGPVRNGTEYCTMHNRWTSYGRRNFYAIGGLAGGAGWPAYTANAIEGPNMFMQSIICLPGQAANLMDIGDSNDVRTFPNSTAWNVGGADSTPSACTDLPQSLVWGIEDITPFDLWGCRSSQYFGVMVLLEGALCREQVQAFYNAVAQGYRMRGVEIIS